MQNEMKINQVAYGIIKVQIEFGVYRYGDRLPTIEEASDLLMVAHKSVSLAYRQLKQEGYISLSARVGATVNVKYSEQEIEQHIQTFFAARKDALLDLICSMRLFFDSDIQLASWISIPEEGLVEMERIAARKVDPSYRIIKHHRLVYGSLENDLLMHLIWKICMFFLAPLLSAEDYREYLDAKADYLAQKIELRRQKNWPALISAAKDYQDLFYSAVRSFYETRITMPPLERQIPFTWSSYKNVTQICYSLGLELMIGISRGVYPAGSFLPSLDRLAKEKQVSISTVRRTLAMLSDLGIAKSINGIGTRILPIDQLVENCDLSKPSVRNRFIGHLQSLQLFSLTCREVAYATIPTMDATAIAEWKERLNAFQNNGRLDIPTAVSLNFLMQPRRRNPQGPPSGCWF